MVVGGLCQSCGRYAHGLFTCHTCGARCCPQCLQSPIACKICKGVKRI